MSSHHIVREKQEPALLVQSLQNFNLEWLGQLLEWSPTVVTTAAMAETLAVYDIKVDVVVGDVEELPQGDIKYMKINGDDEVNAALQYLAAEGYPAVNIIADNLQLDAYRPFVQLMDIVIYLGNKKVMAVRPGYSKWVPAGHTVEILEQPDNFLSTGLDTLTNNNYTTTRDGVFTLQFTGAYLFIAEQL